jgi:hypothetical protein
MARVGAGLGLLVLCLLVAGPSGAQNTQPGRRVRGRLPTYWNRLGLSDQQKKDVFAVQAKYQEQIDELLQKIDKIKTDRRQAMEKVLTPAQKLRLREILTEKAPASGTADVVKPKPPKDKP